MAVPNFCTGTGSGRCVPELVPALSLCAGAPEDRATATNDNALTLFEVMAGAGIPRQGRSLQPRALAAILTGREAPARDRSKEPARIARCKALGSLGCQPAQGKDRSLAKLPLRTPQDKHTQCERPLCWTARWFFHRSATAAGATGGGCSAFSSGRCCCCRCCLRRSAAVGWQ